MIIIVMCLSWIRVSLHSVIQRRNVSISYPIGDDSDIDTDDGDSDGDDSDDDAGDDNDDDYSDNS